MICVMEIQCSSELNRYRLFESQRSADRRLAAAIYRMMGYNFNVLRRKEARAQSDTRLHFEFALFNDGLPIQTTSPIHWCLNANKSRQ